MGIVKVGNGFYFLYIGIAAILLLSLVLLLRKRSRKTVRTVLLVLLFANLALHYLKQAFPPYIKEFPLSLRMSAMQNLCAVSTILFPFIYLFKKQNILHDYAFFIGVVGGAAALFYPTEALGKLPFAFDTIRFYLCHTILFAVPMTAAVLGVYRPRLKRFWAIPLLFLGWQAIICANDCFLVAVGLVKGEFSDLLNPGFHNSSFTFGVRPDFAWAAKVFDPLVPWFLRTDAFGLNGGVAFYFPVLWLIGPSFVFLIPIYLLVSSPFWISKAVKRKRNKPQEIDGSLAASENHE